MTIELPKFYLYLQDSANIIEESEYFTNINSQSIDTLILSIYNLHNLLKENNMLYAINLTKIPDKHAKQLAEILHTKYCSEKTNVELFIEHVDQYNFWDIDVGIEFYKENSFKLPFDKATNLLCNNTVNKSWECSIASLAVTEYAFTLLNKLLNKYATKYFENPKIHLDESFELSKQLLQIINDETNDLEIHTTITETVNIFLLLLMDIKHIFYDSEEIYV